MKGYSFVHDKARPVGTGQRQARQADPRSLSRRLPRSGRLPNCCRTASPRPACNPRWWAILGRRSSTSSRTRTRHPTSRSTGSPLLRRSAQLGRRDILVSTAGTFKSAAHKTGGRPARQALSLTDQAERSKLRGGGAHRRRRTAGLWIYSTKWYSPYSTSSRASSSVDRIGAGDANRLLRGRKPEPMPMPWPGAVRCRLAPHRILAIT